MKTFLLTSFAFLAIFSKAQTSVYHEFPDSNAVWNFNFWAYCFASGTGDEYYSIAISGDTVIASQTYHKLTTPYVESYSTGTCGGINTGYKGAVREDVLNKKVYYYHPSASSEELLYDFNMQVGDTLKGFIANDPFGVPLDTVQEIDSVLVGATYRKRWIINTCYNISFIEGIGSIYGFFEASPGCLTDLPAYSLTCFKQNGNSLYPDTTANCELITTINSPEISNTNIKIYPNPSNGSFTIDHDLPIKEIHVTDLIGNIIYAQHVNNQSTIKIQGLPAGTFIVTLTDFDNKSNHQKIVSCK